MSKDKLLSIKNLHISFASKQTEVKAVKGINFEIRKGETLGVVGESGSGKSVTALSMMGLIPANQGSVQAEKMTLNGQNGDSFDVLSLKGKQWQQIRGKEIAMIFQEPMSSLNPVFTCGDQVTEAILLHQGGNNQQAKAKTLELFEKVQLGDVERIFRAYPHQLSGGQKQRVMIAMAISSNPTLLIADEPTTALDVTVQKSILELLNSLKSELNMAMMFISHDLGVIAEIADRVIVMNQGEIVESGMVEQIFDTPQHPYTKGLLACRPPLDKKLRRLPVIADFVKEKHKESKIEVLDHTKQLNRIKQLHQSAPLLKVKELSTWFPGKKNFWGKPMDYIKAVDDVSFELFPGETLGLVGESGSGKTTLGRTLLRLQPAKKGEIWYRDQNVLDLDNKELIPFRKRAQIIFQDPYASLNPKMTVGQAIMEPMFVHQIGQNQTDRKERAMTLLKQVKMETEHFYRYPFEFSGGQRQRIGIARALAVEPELLVCDESVSALDVSVQAQILNLLLDLQETRKLTYIFISHDLSVVKFMSDRMMVMRNGRIMEHGNAMDIYSNPKTEYTQKLIEAIPR